MSSSIGWWRAPGLFAHVANAAAYARAAGRNQGVQSAACWIRSKLLP
ncbi:hypothetical protein RHECNPAF_850026 [Rhizobium etli CNPAF512]|nr:hypothetical protein RHECNPAF_850026 [Rhizobium etli CNPAF512]